MWHLYVAFAYCIRIWQSHSFTYPTDLRKIMETGPQPSLKEDEICSSSDHDQDGWSNLMRLSA